MRRCGRQAGTTRPSRPARAYAEDMSVLYTHRDRLRYRYVRGNLLVLQ